MSDETRSLHRKLAQIMYEADRIPKNGTAPREMGGYKFVQVGDAADYIRKALAEKVITMMPVGVQVTGQADRPTKSGGSMTTVDLVTTWRLTDGESGETIEIQSFGAGADGGDKYSGKASTSAMKYALLTGFLLSTGEDSELGNTEAGQSAGQATGQPARRETPKPQSSEPTLVGPWSGTGEIVVRKTGQSDGNLRQGPDGGYFIVAFKPVDGPGIPQVLVRDPLAVDMLDAAGADLNGLICTIEGDEYSVPFRNGDFSKPFPRIHLKRIRTAGWSLPVPAETHGAGPSPDAAGVPSEEPAAVPPAPSLFDEATEAELDAALR